MPLPMLCPHKACRCQYPLQGRHMQPDTFNPAAQFLHKQMQGFIEAVCLTRDRRDSPQTAGVHSARHVLAVRIEHFFAS
eukprot:3367788-Amphidinium_carterae.2